MNVDILLGLQWGDEGKGKIVDVLAPSYDIIARFQGGPNAGHTIEFDRKKFVLHHIPSGIFDPDILNVIGNGVIIDPFILRNEIEHLKASGIDVAAKLLVSKKAHLILPTHKILDAVYETSKQDKKIGSTLKGIGPTYTDKISRIGIRAGLVASPNFYNYYKELKMRHLTLIKAAGKTLLDFSLDGKPFDEYEENWFSAVSLLRELALTDTEYYLNEALSEGKNILAEGAQGTLLDVDFGTYPFVTSSNTVASGVFSGLGIAPSRAGRVFGVFKAYCTRVGNGPFPTELLDETGDLIRNYGNEFGSTTGRPRRCGWLDLPALRYAIMLNGVTDLYMTKTDVLNAFGQIKVCTGYNGNTTKYHSDLFETEYKPDYQNIKGWQCDLSGITAFDKLPGQLKEYIGFIEKAVRVPVKIVSTGPDRTQTIRKQ